MASGFLRNMNGTLYTVIRYKKENGESARSCKTTHLSARGGRAAADRILSERLAEYELLERRLSGDLNYAECYRFTDYILDCVNEIGKELSPSTYSGYQALAKATLVPFFEPYHLMLSDVRVKHIKDFKAHEFDRGVTRTTVRNSMGLLHRILEQAYRDELIPSNPASKVSRPAPTLPKNQTLSASELNQLLDLAQNTKLYIVILLAAFYGLRRSEVLGVRWSAIDFVRKTLVINHTVLDTHIDGKCELHKQDITKTKSSYRTLPLPDSLASVLLEWRETQRRNKEFCKNCYHTEDEDYVCTDFFGKLIPPDYIEHAFPQLIARLNLNKHIRFHDLRHTCATLLHEQGMSLKQVQDQLGHSTIAITANIYTHLSWESKRETVQAMEGILTAERPLNHDLSLETKK